MEGTGGEGGGGREGGSEGREADVHALRSARAIVTLDNGMLRVVYGRCPHVQSRLGTGVIRFGRRGEGRRRVEGPGPKHNCVEQRTSTKRRGTRVTRGAMDVRCGEWSRERPRVELTVRWSRKTRAESQRKEQKEQEGAQQEAGSESATHAASSSASSSSRPRVSRSSASSLELEEVHVASLAFCIVHWLQHQAAVRGQRGVLEGQVTRHRGWHWGCCGNAEGPQFNMSGANIGSLAVHGDVYLNPETRNKSLAVMRQQHHKLCPLPVSSFKGRKDILQEMHQHLTVIKDLSAFLSCMASGVQEKTIETDLKTVAPAVVGKSTEAILHWLAGKQEDAGSRVSDMELEDAKDLLLQLAYQGRSDKQEKLSSNEQEKLAVAIVKELYCFPLAVSQAGGYIHARGKLSEYLKLYQNHRDQLLQCAEIQGQRKYGQAVYATWNLSYQRLSSPGRTMLQICSSLHHKGILEQIFERAAMSQQELDDSELQKEVIQFLTELGKRAGNWDSWVFHEVMGELESYSLIERDRQDDSYCIHPLVQHWSGTIGASRHLLQKCVLAMIGLSISWSFQDEDYKYRHKLLQHITRSIDSLNREEICTFVATRIRQVYFEGGRWKDAEALEVVVMKKRKYVLGEEHPDTLTSMANLAATYRNQGRWKDAETLQVVVMEKRKHPHIGTRGRWKDAEVLEVVVMEKSKHVLGKEHPDTLMSMANLAATYRNQGPLEGCRGAGGSGDGEEEAWPLEGCKGTGGGGDGEEEASTYWNQGHWKDAEALQLVVMEKRKHVLGEEHPDTLTSMANLAATYWNQGHWKDAEALEVVVMEKRKHVLGEEHPDTLTSMANLAATYRHQGRWKDAEVLEVMVMEKSKHVLGEEHPDTLMSMANLAATYWNKGYWKDAEALQVVVMEKRKHMLGEDHPDTLTSMANLGATYWNQGHWKDAEALQLVVMEKRKHVLGKEHPDTLTSMANLAATYWNQGRWKDAEVLEVVVMEKRKYVLGEEHPDTLTSMANLAATYQNQGRWKDAEALQVVVMEESKHVLGEKHPDTLTSMANVTATYRNQGRWKDAETLEVVVMEKRKYVLGEEHPDPLMSMANLAVTYWNQGRWKDAEALQVVVMEKRKHVLGEEHPDTLTSMANLAAIYRNQGRWKDAEVLQVVRIILPPAGTALASSSQYPV
ncbi:hypothetical protein B0H14DRAFT_2651109 [Mycena olivaceomarginata]|nr:hypothetical protein B0H14DRAFT_2651109 [Mycena olivaceomarginata]